MVGNIFVLQKSKMNGVIIKTGREVNEMKIVQIDVGCDENEDKSRVAANAISTA